MKIRILSLILTLALLLPSFAGCNSETVSSPSPQGIGSAKPADASAVNQAGADGEEAETKPDYSGFTFPDETGTLTVYSYSLFNNTVRKALDLFQNLYPDVKVDFQALGEDEYTERIRAEIPAGRGPDVFFGVSSVLPDIYKTMSTGIFTDLAPFMANDEDYDPEDYFEGVMNGGVMFGKQYFLPLVFGLNALMTSEELLEKNGLTSDDLKTWDGFLDACSTFHENNPGKPLINWGGSSYYLTQLYQYAGFRLIDYEQNKVAFNEERFRQLFDLSRLYCYPKKPANLLSGDESNELKKGECLFGDMDMNNPSMTANLCALMRRSNQTPVLISIPNESGGFTGQIVNYAAIPEASGNKLNAWRFIKVLLSPEMQGGTVKEDDYPENAYPVGNSVHRESLRRLTTLSSERKFLPEEDMEQFFRLADRITDAVMFPPVLQKYITQYMVPYIKSEDGSNYDKQLEQFRNALELYKDE